MPEISDAVNEAVEKARESKLNTIVAVCVAVIATFMSLCNVKAGNIIQQINLSQANAVDQWAYYQSKSTKSHVAEAAIDQLTLARDMNVSLTPDQKQKYDEAIKKQEAGLKKFEKEKEDIRAKAQGFEQQRDALDVHNDQFDMAEALMSVAIAMLGVTALTQKRWMLFVAGLFGGFGMFMGIAGFAKLAVHPDWLAKLLG
jgi:predicted ribosome quality control (RQC) complex YloA/Tae2 family protein